jgi:putative ABC transport system ATP-binding protein
MQSVAEARPRLIVNHVTRRFGSGRTAVTAVDDVSLTVSAGEAVLIMGPSGSGKSTLLSMLGGLLSPSEGSIVLDSTEITALDERALPDIRLRHFGFVFQDFNLLPALSALENVALVAELAGMPRSASRQKATDLLSRFDLSERLDHRPEHLSGGEKQRVALARALINDPTLILADEPTANLDSSIGHQVMRLLRDIAGSEQRGVIIVSHDERLKAIADRVLWLEDGRLAETSRLLLDPVCGMAVAPERAVTIELDGRTVAFCARGCRDEFLADPHRFADASHGPADRGQEA